VYTGIAHAVQTVFLWVTPSTALVFLLALLIKEVPLRGRGAPGQEAVAPEAEALIG
jgi:cytochrome c-type biogenesis protein CcmH/NrfF